MAEKLRIRKLAQRVGRTPEELLEVLRNLGEVKYRTPDDMIPGEVTEKLEKALADAGLLAPPPPKKREEKEAKVVGPPPMPAFILRQQEAAAEAARVALAVETAKAAEVAAAAKAAEAAEAAKVAAAKALTEPKVAVKPAPPKPAVPKQAEAKPAVAPKVAAFKDLAEAPKAVVEAAAAPAPSVELPEAAREQVRALEARVVELTRALEEAKKAESAALALQRVAIDRLAPSAMELQEAQGQIVQMTHDHQAQLDLMQQKVNRSEATLRAQEVEELTKIVSQRGVESAEDVAALLGLLLGHEWYRRTVEHIRVVDGERLVRLLKQKVTLWCGDARCKVPEGSSALPISPASRCDICQGKDIVRLAEKLVLQCRAKSVRRLVLVGGSAREVGEFMRAVSGRLDVRWVEPTTVRTVEEIAAEIDETIHLVVLWSGSELPHRLAASYSATEGLRQVEVRTAGLTGFLEELTSLL